MFREPLVPRPTPFDAEPLLGRLRRWLDADIPYTTYTPTHRVPDAAAVHARLQALNVVTDLRGTRLRVGFGIYQTEAEVDALLDRLARL